MMLLLLLIQNKAVLHALSDTPSHDAATAADTEQGSYMLYQIPPSHDAATAADTEQGSYMLYQIPPLHDAATADPEQGSVTCFIRYPHPMMVLLVLTQNKAVLHALSDTPIP